MGKWLWSALLIAGLGLASGSCIIVTDECDSGEWRCDSELVEDCVGGNWEVTADCWATCAGECGMDEYGQPVCICP